MKRLCWVIWLALAGKANAYIDSAPTLGRIINESTNIVVLQVEKVSKDKRVIIYRKIADLKGSDPSRRVKHLIREDLNPRACQTILQWAEPGKIAICFFNVKVAQICVGRYWYECHAGEPPWWTMTGGRPYLSFAYSGAVEKLRQHVQAILEGREVVITAAYYRVETAEVTWQAMTFKRSAEGKEFPIWRFRASLSMPGTLFELVRSPAWVVGEGAGGPEDVASLLRTFQQGERQARLEAATDLGLLGRVAEQAVPSLSDALKDPDPAIQVSAAGALVKIDPSKPAALRALIGGLRASSASIRKAAAESLAYLGPEAYPAVAGLIHAVNDPDADVRWAAIEALGRIGTKARAALPTLVPLLDAPDTPVRLAAIDALAWIGMPPLEAIQRLRAALEDADEKVQWAAALALVRLDRAAARAAVPLFLRALENKDVPSREDALFLLFRIGAEQEVPVSLLIELLAEKEPGLRGWAFILLGLKGAGARDVLPLLKETFEKEENPWVRNWAAWALVQIGGPGSNTDAIPLLIDGLQTGEPLMRERFARCLGQFGPVAREAVPALTARLDDEHGKVRAAAEEALRLIEPAAVLLAKLPEMMRDTTSSLTRRLGGLLVLGFFVQFLLLLCQFWWMQRSLRALGNNPRADSDRRCD
jgi:HEAT repeat protein